MDEFANTLGVLGTYFAILLVLSVAVESFLDVVKLSKRLGLRSRVSPEQALKDAAEWVPPNSQENAKIAAITNLVSEFKVSADQIEQQVTAVKEISPDIVKAIGAGGTLTDVEKRLGVTLSALRKKYIEDEQRRISILRVISAVIGIVIAIVLKIDSFVYLTDLISLNKDFLQSPIGQYGGMVLTGLAASAGSSFWHDQLDKIRALKQFTRQQQDESN